VPPSHGEKSERKIGLIIITHRNSDKGEEGKRLMEECSCVLWFFRALEDLVDKPSCVKKIFCDRVYGGNEMTLRKGWLSKPRH